MADVKTMTVGLLFFGALVALGALTIMLSNFNPFQKTYVYEVYCDMANELKPQDNVLIMGTRQGKVERVEFFEKPLWCTEGTCDLWVKVTIRMKIPLRLKEDYSVTIRNANTPRSAPWCQSSSRAGSMAAPSRRNGLARSIS